MVLATRNTTQRRCGWHAGFTESNHIEIPLILQNTKIFYQNSHLHRIYNGHVNNLVLGSWLNKQITYWGEKKGPKRKRTREEELQASRKQSAISGVATAHTEAADRTRFRRAVHRVSKVKCANHNSPHAENCDYRPSPPATLPSSAESMPLLLPPAITQKALSKKEKKQNSASF